MPVSGAVEQGTDDVDAVRVVRGAEERAQHVQLADNVADVEQLDEQVERDEVVAAVTPERRTQQARQRVLQTDRPLRTALTNEAGVLDERALRRQISTHRHRASLS